MIATLSCAAPAPGSCASSSAATPAVMGEAMLVPDHPELTGPLVYEAPWMLTPGAMTSTDVGPQLEKEAKWSVLSDAATQRMLGSGRVHGYVAAWTGLSLSSPSLPADTTNSVFGCAAIASEMSCDCGPPIEALTIFASWAAA